MKILRSLIEVSNRVLGNVKAGRVVTLDPDTNPVKVNLGCGLAVTNDWVNIDGSINALVASLPVVLQKVFYRLTGARNFYTIDEYCKLLSDHIFIHHDLSKSIPLKDNTVDYIYSSHFLEHLFIKDAKHLLKDCCRVIKKGGIVRIVIPDLEYALALFAKGKKKEMLENYFFVDRDDNFYSRHKYMYDFELLSQFLQDAGFSNIRRCEFKHGDVPDIEILDNRPEDSLHVEATK